MAFVLVHHLAPDHKSILTDLVKRYTRMEVTEVKDGMVVKPNCTYIIPPNCDMAFQYHHQLYGYLHDPMANYSGRPYRICWTTLLNLPVGGR